MADIIIMEELKDFLDTPSKEEFSVLEKSLIKEKGPRDPIVVWEEKNAIVDGHNRYKICKAHNLPFKTVKMSFKDIEAVKEWMLVNQLGRRNLSPLRMTYYLGTLYNMQKQDTGKREKMDQTTAQKLGEQFQVSERTVRRAGDEAKGVDAVGRALNISSVSDKIAAIKAKNKENVSFTKEELADIGKLSSPALQEEVVKQVVAIKKAEAAPKKTLSAPKAPNTPKVTYPVAFCKPAFDALGYNPATEAKPPLSENAIVYMAVPDEELAQGMELLNKWGLTYEGSFIFHIDGYEGLWSDVRHMYLLCATRGTVVGPKKGSSSLHMEKGDTDAMMVKLIESYHPQQKRVDMRKKNGGAQGWDVPLAA